MQQNTKRHSHSTGKNLQAIIPQHSIHFKDRKVVWVISTKSNSNRAIPRRDSEFSKVPSRSSFTNHQHLSPPSWNIQAAIQRCNCIIKYLRINWGPNLKPGIDAHILFRHVKSTPFKEPADRMWIEKGRRDIDLQRDGGQQMQQQGRTIH